MIQGLHCPRFILPSVHSGPLGCPRKYQWIWKDADGHLGAINTKIMCQGFRTARPPCLFPDTHALMSRLHIEVKMPAKGCSRGPFKLLCSSREPLHSVHMPHTSQTGSAFWPILINGSR